MSAIVTYPTTDNLQADTSKITLDKILQAINSGGGSGGGTINCGCVVQGHGEPAVALPTPPTPTIPYIYTDLDTGIAFAWNVDTQAWI